MPKLLSLIATLLLLTGSARSQTPDGYEFVFSSDSALGDVTAPWPAGDSLLLPAFPPIKIRENAIQVTLMLFVAEDSTVKKWNVDARPPSTGIEQELERVIPTWRFKPASSDGNAIPVWIPLYFEFLDPDLPGKLKPGADPLTGEREKAPCQRYVPVDRQPSS